MILKLPDIEIPNKNPFVNCKLGREKIAEVYTQLLNNSFSGGTILINNSWGCGKTTFLKMWKPYLKNFKDINCKPIYLDAWGISKNDNILLTLLGEIRKVLNSKKKDFKRLPKALLSSLPYLLDTVDQTSIVSSLNSVIDKIKEGTDIDPQTEKKLFDIQNKGAWIKEFQNGLKEYGEKEKIIFLIDELDRCKPDRAIKFLEIIKYFFVENIFFVITVDKKELNHIVTSYYGNSYDSNYYFKKFIDLELSLPTPSNLELIIHFLGIFRIEDLLNKFNKKEKVSTNYNFDKFIINLLSLKEYTPRHIKQVIQQFHIVYNMLIGYEMKSGKNNFLLATVCFLLIDIKYRNPNIIQKILALSRGVWVEV